MRTKAHQLLQFTFFKCTMIRTYYILCSYVDCRVSRYTLSSDGVCLSVIFSHATLNQDISVCLPLCVIFSIEQDGSTSYSTSFIYKTAVFASLCHIKYHTRRQCLPHCVVFIVIQDGSVYLTVSYSISYKTAVFASLCHALFFFF